MTKATSTLPRLRDYVIEGSCIVLILLVAGISANLVATVLEGHFAHACAIDLAKVLQ